MLWPQSGAPGTQVTITAVGYGPCLDPPSDLRRTLSVGPVFALQWGPTAVDLAQASIEGANVVVRYTVPDDPAAGDSVTVSASCTFPATARTGSTVLQNDAPFTVTAPQQDPTLTLDASTGPPGAEITASGSDFACAPSEIVQLFWDGTGEPMAESSASAFSMQLTVPETTPLGGHSVVARCQDHSAITASRPFEVTQTQPPAVSSPPTLAVQPTSGHPGDPTRISGERFICANHAGIVDIRWDDETPLGSPPVDPTGHFEMAARVPSDADARGHLLHAVCADKSVAMVTPFTVLATDVPPPPVPAPAAAMALQPSAGHRGDQVRITGEGFACPDRTVQLSWDDGTRLTTSIDASGGFATAVAAPRNADVRSHPLKAACSDASVALTAAFIVLPESPSPPPTPNWLWAIAVLLALAAALVARHTWHRLNPRPPHIHAVARLGGLPLVAVQETPAHGESSCALRLEAHSGVRTLTVDEVNDDHTPVG